MSAPNEILEDFFAPAPDPASRRPAVRSVRPSGAIEVLKPLARSEHSTKVREPGGGAFVPPAPFPAVHQEFTWFHRSLAVGGLLATLAFVSSSIFIAISDTPVEQDATRGGGAAYVQPGAPAPDEAVPFAAVPAEDSPDPDDFRVLPAAIRRSARPRAVFAAHRPRRAVRRMVISKFVPTTLVIYPENGVIKTRIEPHLTASYNRHFRTS